MGVAVKHEAVGSSTQVLFMEHDDVAKVVGTFWLHLLVGSQSGWHLLVGTFWFMEHDDVAWKSAWHLLKRFTDYGDVDNYAEGQVAHRFVARRSAQDAAEVARRDTSRAHPLARDGQ